MLKNNPYIPLVQSDKDILKSPEEIVSHRGKWSQYFWNTHPLVLEIGTGMGNFFGKIVWENPEKNFIGMEIRYKRLWTTAQKAREAATSSLTKGELRGINFVVLKELGQRIDTIFDPWELAETYIFFPDPWANKERQKKHRLVGEELLKKLSLITKSWGKLYFKTDHREYFESVLEILPGFKEWKQNICSFDYEKEQDLFDMKNITEFEAHYRGKNLQIHYLELERI